MYLVDTNIISVRAPSRVPLPELTTWMDAHSTGLFLSTVTIAEIQDGIAKARRAGATRKARDLTAWLETVLHLYTARILPFDLATARLAGDLSDQARASGHAPGFADIIIAATAQHHGLIILTRNLRHFAPLGVPTHDPLLRLPRP